MKANLFYQLEVSEASGRLLRRTRKRRGRSFLGQMAQFMEAVIGVRNVSNIRDITNTLRTIEDPGFRTNQFMFISAVGAAGNLTRHIVVGTGSTEVVGTDFNLETLIGNGSGSGQLLYSEGTISTVSAGPTSATITFTRSCSNSSGGSITVREIGLRCLFTQLGLTFQLIRDVLPAAEVVGTGQVLTVVYTVQIAV